MPSNIRQDIKRKLSAVQSEIQKAVNKLGEVALIYEKDHSEYFEAMQGVCVGLITLKDAVEGISDAI